MKRRGSRGFTILELMIAMVAATLVVGAGVYMYKKAQDMTTYMGQRSVVQGNARAAVNQMTQDLNMAGYGFPIGGITVPAVATYGCTGSSTSAAAYAWQCPPNALAFPVVSGNATLSGIMPGYQQGASVNGNKTDLITISYVDSSPNFAQDNPAKTLGFDAYPLIQTTVAGANVTLFFDPNTSPAVNDNQFGFKKGDLIMVSNGSGQAIGEVTSVGASSIQMFGGDAMNLNQAFGVGGSVPNILPGGTATYPAGKNPLPPTTATRVYMVTYYVQTDVLAQASGSTAAPPRLYREVNGDSSQYPPVPVAEQIANMTFTYNLFNSVCGGSQASNQAQPTINQIGLIKTVNAFVTAASTLNTSALPGQKIQQVPLSTSVSPRNLSYFDSYSSTATPGC